MGIKRKRNKIKKEYDLIEVEYNKPYLMIEGMTKKSVKQVIQILNGIYFDYREHQSVSRLRRFINTDKIIKQLLSREEKELFINSSINYNPYTIEGIKHLNILDIFPQFQEVLDYDKNENKKYYHLEKRLRVESSEINEPSSTTTSSSSTTTTTTTILNESKKSN